MRRIMVVVLCAVGLLWISPVAHAESGPGQTTARSMGTAGLTAGGTSALADFNGDGFRDLAIGVPLEDARAGATDDGAVNVLYGSGTEGLSPGAVLDDQLWGQSTPDVEGGAETGDEFGRALAAGDFNGDGFVDLAIGAPGENARAGAFNDGGVNVLYGSGTEGLSPDAVLDDQLWGQSTPDVEGSAESGDNFGEVLAAGDFNGDSIADLAIGVPQEDARAGAFNDGGVNVLYGSAAEGLSVDETLDDQLWGQSTPDVEGGAETGDNFGGALAAGDFNGDGIADLAIGAPNEDARAGATNDGGVNVLYGSAAEGLSVDETLDDQLWGQSTPDVEGGAETDDHFGLILAAGDFNSDSIADLAIGVPLESARAGVIHDGGVNVLYGSGTEGLSPDAVLDDQLWGQSTPDVEGSAEFGDQFGEALAAGDFNGDSIADLAIGVPQEDARAGAFNDGGVNVLYGSAAEGLSVDETLDDQLWGQSTPDVEGGAESGDEFGEALAAGDFNGDSIADLAIGAPLEDARAGATNDGGVNVLYGSGTEGLSPDAVLDDQLWGQSTPDVEGGAETGDQFGMALTAI